MKEVLLLLFGFAVIVKAADVLVDSASNLANDFRVPKVLIALTIVSFGTCAPELAISFNSIFSNNGSVALANIIGSCIINIALVIGIAAIINPIKVKNATIKKEIPILVYITALFSLLMIRRVISSGDNFIHRIDGILLVLSFVIFLYYLFSLVKKNYIKNEYTEVKKSFNKKSIIYIIISLFLIALSSDLIVDNAIIIAGELGISQKAITMIVIVIGTSLPELVTTITAARKKHFDMAIGNIIGTNIFNICIVFGLFIMIFGQVQIIDFSIIDFLVLLLSSLMLLLFSKSEKVLSRFEGVLMIAVCILYYCYIIFI